MAGPYRKAPIVEAVIDVQFAPLSHGDVNRIMKRLERDYPSVSERTNLRFEVSGDKLNKTDSFAGYEMRSRTGTDIIIVQLNSLTTSRLAPYSNWDDLFNKARDNFLLTEKILKRRLAVSRYATKFINRIDIPVRKIATQPISDFLRIGISLPNDLTTAVATYNMSGMFLEPSGKEVILASAMIPGALIDFASFTLELDVFEGRQIPSNVTALWDSIYQLRNVKNRIFEGVITDNLRELIA